LKVAAFEVWPLTVTVTCLPVPSPAGVVARICVSLIAVIVIKEPLRRTEANSGLFPKPLPEMVIVVLPAVGPEAGVIEVIDGAANPNVLERRSRKTARRIGGIVGISLELGFRNPAGFSPAVHLSRRRVSGH
jgi:hypothetical protein